MLLPGGGTYAAQKGTRIGMEANPAVYGTQFVNETKYAFALARDVASEGFGVNLDVGTMLTNGESLDGIAEHLSLVTHVHVSEPGPCARGVRRSAPRTRAGAAQRRL